MSNNAEIQQIALDLQSAVPEDDRGDPQVQAVLEHWIDSTDLGVLEVVLQTLATRRGQPLYADAAKKIKATYHARHGKKGGHQPGQRTLEQTLQRQQQEEEQQRSPIVNITSENITTLPARQSLLLLSRNWKGLDSAGRESALARVLNELSEARIQQHAPMIARAWSATEDNLPPADLLSLRIQLREPLVPQERAADGGSTSSSRVANEDQRVTEPRSEDVKQSGNKKQSFMGNFAAKRNKRTWYEPELTAAAKRKLQTVQKEQRPKKVTQGRVEREAQTHSRRRVGVIELSKIKTAEEIEAYNEQQNHMGALPRPSTSSQTAGRRRIEVTLP